ncbi:cytochrome c biogenesis protein ResB, partial [bacterium]|nr:cytochrome c biogenesis protein ResB [bacterium]
KANHVLDIQEWRLFQSDFTSDNGLDRSIFKVVYDPGVKSIYLGCFILLLGMASVFFSKHKNGDLI